MTYIARQLCDNLLYPYANTVSHVCVCVCVVLTCIFPNDVIFTSSVYTFGCVLVGPQMLLLLLCVSNAYDK